MNEQVNYTLIFKNNSTLPGNACVYQKDPGFGPNIMSLAWFSKYAFQTTQLTFQWKVDYSFVWSQTGQLIPGVIFAASQYWPADLSTSNKVTFTNQAGAYTFKDQVPGPTQGSLYIYEDGKLPSNQASVGIGMSGYGTFVQQAQPNLELAFTPHPEYWITFGNYTQGQVLNVQSITQAARVEFPVNVFSMTAILNPDNTWTINSTAAVNAAFVNARMMNPKAQWGVSEKAPEDASLIREYA